MSASHSHSDGSHSKSDSDFTPSDDLSGQPAHAQDHQNRHINQINYLGTFQTPNERINSEAQQKVSIPAVHYAKFFESSIVYMSVLAFASFTYWADLRYDIVNKLDGQVRDGYQAVNKLGQRGLELGKKHVDNMTPLHLFVTCFLIFCFIGVLVKCLKGRGKKAADQEEEETIEGQQPDEVRPLDQDELPSFPAQVDQHQNFIKKISPAVYEWEATVGTRAELLKLTQSAAYQAMQSKKGNDVAQYNWKTKEIEAGHIETEDYELKFCALDLNAALSKMDTELSKEKEDTDSKRQQSEEYDDDSAQVQINDQNQEPDYVEVF